MSDAIAVFPAERAATITDMGLCEFGISENNLPPFKVVVDIDQLLDDKARDDCIRAIAAQLVSTPLKAPTSDRVPLAEQAEGYYAALRELADARGLKPSEKKLGPSSDFTTMVSVRLALSFLPQPVTDYIVEMRTPIILINKPELMEALDRAIMQREAGDPIRSRALSDNFAVFANWRGPHVLMEEMAHHAEGRLFGNEGSYHFSHLPVWRVALNRDLGQANPVYDDLIAVYDTFITKTIGKANHTLKPGVKAVPVDDADKADSLFAESLVDIAHIARMVRMTLDNQGKIELGGKVFKAPKGREGQVADTVMLEALPDIWPLFRGPDRKQGHALFWNTQTGEIAEIPRRDSVNAPAGMEQVRSFPEACRASGDQLKMIRASMHTQTAAQLADFRLLMEARGFHPGGIPGSSLLPPGTARDTQERGGR